MSDEGTIDHVIKFILCSETMKTMSWGIVLITTYSHRNHRGAKTSTGNNKDYFRKESNRGKPKI